MAKNLYQILNLPEQADTQTIQKAYETFSQPITAGAGPVQSNERSLDQNTQAVNLSEAKEAYSILLNPDLKKGYDEALLQSPLQAELFLSQLKDQAPLARTATAPEASVASSSDILTTPAGGNPSLSQEPAPTKPEPPIAGIKAPSGDQTVSDERKIESQATSPQKTPVQPTPNASLTRRSDSMSYSSTGSKNEKNWFIEKSTSKGYSNPRSTLGIPSILLYAASMKYKIEEGQDHRSKFVKKDLLKTLFLLYKLIELRAKIKPDLALKEKAEIDIKSDIKSPGIKF